MTEKYKAGVIPEVETALKSPKVEPFLLTKWYFEVREDGRTLEDNMVAVIVETNTSDIGIEGTLSKGEKAMAVYTTYANLPEIINKPEVVSVAWCGDEVLAILLSTLDSAEITLVNPVQAPIGDQWDSAAYNDFWDPVEQVFGKRIDLLQKVGKKVVVR